ncbi:MAG TPA: carbon starvation protein A [Ruminiclostridium sp.]|nr:carbon starvation protein A [Ruminiclostridium sp.]
MNSLVIIGIAFIFFALAYVFYGGWLVKKWGIDTKAKTPAYTHEDGQDFIPTPKAVVFAHQFSSIAGAGPVTGPIIAAMFGWVPAFLWILFGGVFFGAVQDFTSLYASVKNEGKSIGLIIEQYIGKTGKRLFLAFSWIFSLLVIAAFADIVATTFNGFKPNGTHSMPNAAAASISMIYILVAVLFGLFMKFVKPNQLVMFIVGIVLFVGMMAAGIALPIYAGKMTWLLIVFAYAFIAAILPMWILMQPRDYLSSFLLISMIIFAVIGVVVQRPNMNLPAFTGFEVNGKMLFPTLFVTVACGAISGFHSLVSSGTSSKQVKNEKDMKFIGYGAMIVECMLAVVALVVAGSVAVHGKLPNETPFVIFSTGVAGFLTKLGFSKVVATCVMTMFVSALALTTLDSVARIGRMALQEFFMSNDGKTHSMAQKIATNKYVTTVVTLFFGFLLSQGGYNNIWPLFGSANQLLGALVLIALAVFLKTTGRQGAALWIPMVIMLAVTFTALIQAMIGIFNKLFVLGKFDFLTDGLQLIVAIALTVLGLMVAFNGFKKLKGKKQVQESITAE